MAASAVPNTGQGSVVVTQVLVPPFFAPKGQPHISPGQSEAPPWERVPIASRALKGRNTNPTLDSTQILVSPFQGCDVRLTPTQGGGTLAGLAVPSPGLICFGPFRAKTYV